MNTTDQLSLTFTPASLQIGPNTGVTLFVNPGFSGLSQELSAGLPAFAKSKLAGKKPASLKIWPTANRPFQGCWAIRVSAGQYLSAAGPAGLTTSAWRSWGKATRITTCGTPPIKGPMAGRSR